MREKSKEEILLRKFFWSIFFLMMVAFTWIAFQKGISPSSFITSILGGVANVWALFYVLVTLFIFLIGYLIKRHRPEQHKLAQDNANKILQAKIPAWVIILFFTVFFGIPLLIAFYVLLVVSYE